MLNAWEADQHQIMFKETTCTCEKYLSKALWGELEDEWEKMFHILVLQGKLWTTVQWISGRDKVRVMQPGDAFTNTETSVLDVLRSKHPEACDPSAISIGTYPGQHPKLVPADLTEDTII